MAAPKKLIARYIMLGMEVVVVAHKGGLDDQLQSLGTSYSNPEKDLLKPLFLGGGGNVVEWRGRVSQLNLYGACLSTCFHEFSPPRPPPPCFFLFTISLLLFRHRKRWKCCGNHRGGGNVSVHYYYLLHMFLCGLQ